MVVGTINPMAALDSNKLSMKQQKKLDPNPELELAQVEKEEINTHFEVDASQELLRTQKEAKARNREDRIKNGSLD